MFGIKTNTWYTYVFTKNKLRLFCGYFAMLLPMINILFSYINAFPRMCELSSIAVFSVLWWHAFLFCCSDIYWMILRCFHLPLLPLYVCMYIYILEKWIQILRLSLHWWRRASNELCPLTTVGMPSPTCASENVWVDHHIVKYQHGLICWPSKDTDVTK